VADDEPDESGASNSIGTTIRQLGSTSTNLDDETVLEKAMTATNATKFERLWNGSTAGYESHSEADMALCFHLAFWTSGDRMQIDRLFRRSGLMREKWDEVHYADGSTYGEKTVDRAVSRVDEFYEPPSTDPASNESSTENTSRERPQPRRERQSPTSSEPESRVTVSESRLLDVIDRLEARVLQLEAENEALRAQLEDVQQSHEQHRQQRVQEEPTASAETKSLWERIVSRVELP
jgi:primase-polymerase (primpol)-like protein